MNDHSTRRDNKPSQAEGEDPDRPEQGFVLPHEGHPSQAEGEDFGAADGSEDAADEESS